LYYYIYKITCEETGNVYFGRHNSPIPEDPYYKGSGLWVRWAKAKGLTLHKEIINYCDTFEELCELELSVIKENINDPLCVNLHMEHWEVSGRFAGFYYTPYGVFTSKRSAADAIPDVSASTVFQRCVYCDEEIKPNRWTGQEAFGKTWRQLGWYFINKEESLEHL